MLGAVTVSDQGMHGIDGGREEGRDLAHLGTVSQHHHPLLHFCYLVGIFSDLLRYPFKPVVKRIDPGLEPCYPFKFFIYLGDILLDGRSTLRDPVHHRCQRGVCRTFQNLALFDGLDVLNNILVGGHSRGRSGFLANALRLPAVRREEQRMRARAAELMEHLELTPLAATAVAALPFGTRKRVELARALMAEPRLLLLDEPAGGLDPAARREFLETAIRYLAETGATILFSSHHMADVERVAGRVVMLAEARVLIDSELDALRESHCLTVVPRTANVDPGRLSALDGCLRVRRRPGALPTTRFPRA